MALSRFVSQFKCFLRIRIHSESDDMSWTVFTDHASIQSSQVNYCQWSSAQMEARTCDPPNGQRLSIHVSMVLAWRRYKELKRNVTECADRLPCKWSNKTRLKYSHQFALFGTLSAYMSSCIELIHPKRCCTDSGVYASCCCCTMMRADCRKH